MTELRWRFRRTLPGENVINCGIQKYLNFLPEMWQWNGMNVDRFFSQLHTSRDISELLPHYTQCILMLGIALERYVLICHAATAKTYYIGYRRIGFYILVTIALLIPCSFPLAEAVYYISKQDKSTTAQFMAI